MLTLIIGSTAVSVVTGNPLYAYAGCPGGYAFGAVLVRPRWRATASRVARNRYVWLLVAGLVCRHRGGHRSNGGGPMSDRHITAVSVHGIALVAALELWATRNDKPRPANPDAYGAGHAAVREIDAMIRELHQLRARLVGENREFHDAAMAGAEELLARNRD